MSSSSSARPGREPDAPSPEEIAPSPGLNGRRRAKGCAPSDAVAVAPPRPTQAPPHDEVAQDEALDPESATRDEPIFEEARSVPCYAEFDAIFAQWKRTGDPALRHELILMQRSLVVYMARRFTERSDLYDDVIGVGMVGLINALDGFDPARGVKFSTFAVPTISGEIRRYFRDKVASIRIPRRLQELNLVLGPQVDLLSQQLKRAPTYLEIAEALGIEEEDVIEAFELSAYEPVSLDDPILASEGVSISDTVGEVDPDLQAYEEHAALGAALERLSPQERQVLELTYFQGHSQSEAARRLHLSQMHVSRLMRRALSRLRQLLEEP